MTRNHKTAYLTPITWHEVDWSKSWNDPLTKNAYKWCEQHVGVYRADWNTKWLDRKFCFRNYDDAVVFALLYDEDHKDGF